ncbi:E3 ubiquitin-protein ligase AIP2 [Ricinus communis]|uniref:E3 ubiquitin-protein ligase AIP2 n=1 Tax=Ricinus communis TaxID=3988 RepID=UPI00201A2D35|nr:E3 ubiquitin-protein ligase AIP2 [Ricinus communis]
MASTASEFTLIKQVLQDLNIECNGSIKMYYDNQAARHIASNPVFHERTKHIEVDCHFIREKVQSREIETPFVRSHDQLADIFNKALNKNSPQTILSKMDSINLYEPILRGSVKDGKLKEVVKEASDIAQAEKPVQGYSSQVTGKGSNQPSLTPDTATFVVFLSREQLLSVFHPVVDVDIVFEEFLDAQQQLLMRMMLDLLMMMDGEDVNEPRRGVSRSTLKKLKKERFSAAAAEGCGISSDCAICLEEFGGEVKLIKMPCPHIFHKKCIFGWLKNQKTHPMCRREVDN